MKEQKIKRYRLGVISNRLLSFINLAHGNPQVFSLWVVYTRYGIKTKNIMPKIRTLSKVPTIDEC